MAPGQRVDVADLPPEVREQPKSADVVGDTGWQQSLDRELAQALGRGERNVGDRLEQEAAAWLGWGRNTLTRKIQELGLEAELRKGERGDAGG